MTNRPITRALVALFVFLLIVVGVTIVLLLPLADVPEPAPSSPQTTTERTAPSPAPAPRVLRQHETAADAPPEAAPQPGRIDGVVVEVPSEKPLAGAQILVSRRRSPPTTAGFVDSEPPGEPEFRAETGADGAFAVDVPSEGPWLVLARKAGFADAASLARSGKSVRLDLAKPAEVTLTIRGAPGGEPIAGAEVWVYGEKYGGAAIQRIVSDEHGVVRVSARIGADALLVRAKGRAQDFRGMFFGEGDVWLSPGYSIRGVVRDAQGAPVPGAVLRVMGDDPRGWKCDAEGRFVVDEIKAWSRGGCPIKVEASGFLEWDGELDCGDTEAEVRMQRAGRVEGVVLAPDGTLAAGAKVQGAEFAADGSFRLATIPGTVTVAATLARPNAADALTGTTVCEVPDGGVVSGVIVRLVARSFVVLRLVDDAGRGVTGFRAFLVGGEASKVTGETATLGIAAPAGTPCEVVVSDASKSGRRWSDLRLTLPTQPTATAAPVEVKLPARRELTVSVVGADGAALPPTAIPTISLAEDWPFLELAAVLRTPGAATFTVAEGHRYIAWAEAAGLAPTRRELTSEEIAAGRAVLTIDAGATVRGRLVATDARALSGAAIQLASAPERVGGYRQNPVRGDDGVFRFDKVPRGGWRVVVTWPAPWQVTREFQVEGSGEVNVGDVVLSQVFSVHGVAERPDGRPCGGAQVSVVSLGSDAASVVVAAHEDGSFEVEMPASEQAALLVRKGGLGAVIARIDDRSRVQRVRLAPEGRVEVRIRLPQPAGTAWSSRVETVDGRVRWQPTEDVRPPAVAGFDRRTIYRGLAPGPIVVVAEGAGWRLATQVNVVAGETVVATLSP